MTHKRLAGVGESCRNALDPPSDILIYSCLSPLIIPSFPLAFHERADVFDWYLPQLQP